MTDEPYSIMNDFAMIMPFERDKGGLGYVIAPKQGNGRLLTSDEMAVLLDVYTQLLEGVCDNK